MIRSNDVMFKAGQTETVILRKLSGADPEGKRHVVRLLRTFEYRQHLCLVFENMVRALDSDTTYESHSSNATWVRSVSFNYKHKWMYLYYPGAVISLFCPLAPLCLSLHATDERQRRPVIPMSDFDKD